MAGTRGGRVRVLLVCYQIERGKGSEAGSGYNFLLHLKDTVPHVTVLTRHNNAALLREDADLAGVAVVGYDPPPGLTRWKRGSRGALPFYYLWQAGAGRAARRLHAVEAFDVVHQYNFHTDWAPHFLRFDDARVVWGPICHQPLLPRPYLQLEPVRGLARELAKAALKRFFWTFDPNLRRAIRASDVILFANQEVPPAYRRSGKVVQQTFGGALPGQMQEQARAEGPLRLLHVGRFVSIKGAAVALDALHEARRRGCVATLTLVGEGPLREGLADKVAALGLQDSVRLLPWMDRNALRGQYARADALLYPSLANQDGVVAEALAASLPVIGIDTSGTATMAADSGLLAPRKPYRATVLGLAEAIGLLASEVASDPAAWAGRRARARARSRELSWGSTARDIAARYR